MQALTIQLSDELTQQAKTLAGKRGLTLDQYVADAVTIFVTETQRIDELLERAERASQDEFEEVLRSVPNNMPAPGDEMPSLP